MVLEAVTVEERVEECKETARSESSIPVDAMPPIVLFIHNQRSGGTSFRKILGKNLPPEAVRHWTPKTAGEVATDLTNPAVRAVLQVHSPFGAYPYVGRRFAGITFLRRPVERLISWYHYRRGLDLGREDRKQFLDATTTFEDWAVDGTQREADNGQVRRLSGFDPPYGQCGPEHLELAKANLRHRFVLIGLTERYNESMVLTNVVLGWGIVSDRSRQRTGPEEPISEAVLERVRALNHYDQELYDDAQDWLDQTIGRMRERHGNIFDKLLAKLNAGGKLLAREPMLEEELARMATC